MTPTAPGAAERFVVATECPRCGAPLDFGEGSNAIRCGHCGVNLLVTGRRQVLSYFVRAKLTAAEALATARFAQSPGGALTATDPRLYFVPYYRFTGSEFRWERVHPPLDEREGLADLVGQFRSPVARIALVAAGLTRPAQERIEFGYRSIEKNFVACEAPELGVYSLGVRPGVLRLELFRREELAPRGAIVGVDLATSPAMERGLKSPGAGEVVHREVVARVLSIVYFPFWAIPIGRDAAGRVTVIDAVSGQVVRRDAPTALLAQLDEAAGTEGRRLGFRPLVCPNCGWDLPVRPDDVILACKQCSRAWEIVGDQLEEVPVEVAEAPAGVARDTVTHLPVWVIGAEADPGQRCFVPAFRCRLRVVNDLATKLTRKSPSYALSRGESFDLHGCVFDRDDAIALARFVDAGLRLELGARHRDSPPETRDRGPARLTWFPFVADAYALRDPLTGTSLPKQSLR